MKRIIILAVLCGLLAGCAAMAPDHTMGLVRAFSAEEINADPMRIDGMVVKHSNLTGMRLENITLKNTTFWHSSGRDIVLRNVVFENCRFVDAQFEGGVMENVTFKGGLLTCFHDRDNTSQRTRFSGMAMRNVTFDGVSMESLIMEVTGGSVTLRGMHIIYAQEPLIRGKDTDLVLEDCTLSRIPAIAALDGESTLLVRDCVFSGGTRIGPSDFKKVLFERSVSYSGSVYTPKR